MKYGSCPVCGHELHAVWFVEKELDAHYMPTGRTRENIDYLECHHCGKTESIDDSFAKPWN